MTTPPDPRFRDKLAEETRPVATPGDLLAVLLRDRGMTQASLAAMLRRPAQMVSEVVTGKKSVTATFAVQLERVFGLPATVWLGLQAHASLAAEVEARVQAAANQRAAEELEMAGVLTVPSQDTSEDVREVLFRRADAIRAALAQPAPAANEEGRE